MDVRQLDFLAAQPSAALKPRETFCGISKRALALLLVNVVFWQPIWAQAEGIAVSAGNGATLDRAGNGVPIVNIATPGANGLSHNQFQDYNVDSRGVILNNVTDRTGTTQLGGIIVGNPNLQGRAAGVILNEVVGGSPSQLKGYTEVAGQAARVIVANPYGVTCNGCGFINTPRVTLTTGKPILDGNRLDHFQVDGGSVSLEGNGLNADNVDQFDIVTRSAKLNAELHARQLTIIAGRNDVAADSLAATPRPASPGDAPQLAIDSSALGGMYANTIRLVGTEAGVGVRLAGNLAASAGDIQLDANGQLTVAQTAASGNIALKGQGLDAQGPVYAGGSVNAQSGGDLSIRQSVAAGAAITLNAAGQLTNAGVIEAGVNPDNSRNATGDVSLQGAHITNRGSVNASRSLSATTGGTLDNSGATLSAGSHAQVNATTLNNTQGRLQSRGSLTVQAAALDNTQGIVTSTGALAATLGQTTNGNGELSSQARLSLQGQGLDNRQGKLIGTTGLDLTLGGSLDNRGGTLVSHGDLQARVAGTLDNRQQGNLYGAGASVLSFDQLLNAQGVLASDAALTLTGNQVNNDSGQLGSQGNLTATLGRFDQLDGQFISQGQLTLIADRLGNTGNALVAGKTGLELRVTAVDNRGGEVSSQNGSVSLTGQSLLNGGGKVIAGKGLTLNLATADNSAKGVLKAGENLQATLTAALNNSSGQLLAGGGLILGSASLNNLGGLISGQGAVAVTTGALDNTQGQLLGQSTLDLTAASLDNRQGVLSSVDRQTLTVTDGAIQNDKGQLVTDGGLTLSSASLDNGTGTLSAKGATTLTTTGALDNAQTGRLVGSDTFTVTAGSLTNAGRLASSKDLTVTTATLTNSGELFSQAGVTLDLQNGTLTNATGGLITAPGTLLLKNLKTVHNAGELSSGQAFTLAATSLDNQDGKLISNASLTLRIAQALTNVNGTLSAAGLDLEAASLDNSAGLLTSRQGLRASLAGDLLNDQGELLSEGTLTLTAADLDNRQGLVSSTGQQTLTVTGGAVQNEGGQLVTDGGLTLASASLANGSGTLSAKGAVSLTTTGALDNAQTGRLIGSDTFTITAGSLTNAGRLASAKDLAVTTASLTNSGELFSQAGLTLDLKNGSLTNTRGGLITAPGALLLKNLNSVRNAGELSSGQAFTLMADSLDNSGGKLISNAGLTLRIAQALTNAKGALSAAGLDLEAASLDNSTGLLTSRQDLRVTLTGKRADGQGLLLNDQGQLLSDGTLDLTAADLDNRQGLVSSAGQQTLTVTGGAVQNGGGQLVADGGLSLSSASLANAAGTLSAKGAVTLSTGVLDNSQKGRLVGGDTLTVTAQRLDNSSGLVSSAKALQLTLGADLNNGQGQLLSEDSLNLKAASLDNRRGTVSSAGQQTLTVTGGAVQNDKGQLVTDGGLTLSSASLDNGTGTLSAKGAVTLTTTGALNNAQQGVLVGSDTLTVTAGSLTNAGRLASKDLAVTTAILTNSGELFSQAGLTLDLKNGTLTNSAGGLITAPGALLLNNLGSVRNAGELSSGQAFTLTADSLDNSGGKLISNADLTLRITRALTNAKGTLSAAGLDLKAASLANQGGTLVSRGALDVTTTTGLLDNSADGLLSAATTLDVTADTLSNAGGSLLAKGATTVTAGRLDNSAKGLINSQARLTLTADRLDSSNGGEVSAKGDVQLTLGEFKQQGGRLIGESALALDLGRTGGTGNLDNTGGLITTTGVLSFAHLNQVTNTDGEIGSSQAFTLIAQALDNTRGKLISQGLLKVQASTLTNNGGLLSGWQGLTVTGGSLSNRQSGTLSSKAGDLTATFTGDLDNDDNGALVSQGALKVTAANLTNTGGVLSSGTAQTLTVTGTLQNDALQNGPQGLIDAGTTLSISAGQFANTGGTAQAQGALTLNGGSLDNSGGTVSGQQAVTLDLVRTLTNTGGAVLAQGDLLVKNATVISNAQGRLNSGGLLTLLVGGLDNRSSGTVAAQGKLLITTAGQVLNGSDGLLASQGGALDLTAGSLDNGGGTLQSAGNLTVATGTGDIGNAGGKLIAKNGDLHITGANLDNRGGTLASLEGLFTAGITKLLRNGGQGQTGGIIQAQRLDLTADTLDNYNGKVSALGGNALLKTGSVDNRNGSLYGKGLVQVRGGSFDNSGDNDGQVFGNQIDFSLSGGLNNRLGILESSSTLSLAAASLDNTHGQLRALGTSGTTQLTLGGALDNTHGRLESANPNLQLSIGSLTNTNGTLLHVGTGTFGLGLPLLQNAGGSVTSNGTLTLNGSSWTNSSTLQVANLAVNVDNLTQTGSGQLLASNSFTGTGSNWTNDGLIAAGGNLSLTLGGTYQGAGRLSSGNNFTLNARQLLLDNPNARLTAGSGTTTFTLGGLLRNQARITSAGNFTLNAGQVDNQGTLGASGNLTINTPTLTNQNSSLIFSGGDMGLWVNEFNNSRADVYSLGSIDARGYNGSSQAASFRNISGTLESSRDFSIKANVLENRRESFALGRTLVSGTLAPLCYDCRGDYFTVDYVVREQYESTVTDDSPSAFISAGGSLFFDGGSFSNNRSSVAARNNISINSSEFKNVGGSAGTIERTRVFHFVDITDGTFMRFMTREGMHYIQRNDKDYPNLVAYTDGSGKIRQGRVDAEQVYDADGAGSTYYTLIDTVTGQRVEVPLGLDVTLNSLYSRGDLASLPATLDSRHLVSDVEVAVGGGATQSAIVQAGGKVYIQASQSLENSVVRQDYGYGAGANKIQDAHGNTFVSPTVVQLNSQLPPNLAQQQVNPTTLPGFSLPTGQNGLFRLSSQQGNEGEMKKGTQVEGVRSTQIAAVDKAAIQVAKYTVGRGDDAIQQLLSTQTAGVSPLSAEKGGDGSLSNKAQLDDIALIKPGTLAPVRAELTELGKMRNTNLANGTVKEVAARGLVQGEIPVSIPPTIGSNLPHRYLVETNPALTDLKQFMSSDYLLGNLNYNPDTSWKRLGDGLYEQRLIQQAIIQRTGQRFIAGLNSDEAQFKYLMDNALQSKQALGLSVGVSLTAEQVAALTHDIVWMEDQIVNGEHVLVPVLYLANANNRLAPNGALIQGSDVTLIAGNDLNNAGTLRATNTLTAIANNNLVNSGLIQSGDRLGLTSTLGDITNRAGGIISGRDVSLTATLGDILNERSVTSQFTNYGGLAKRQDYADSAARIEASNNLSLTAGRDINNVGSVLSAGGNATLVAGRDVNLVSAQTQTGRSSGANNTSSSITQLTGSLTAGRDLGIGAGRDLTAVASTLSAGGNASLAAQDNLTLAAAADETHSYSKSKKVTRQEDHVSQQITTLTAGGDVNLVAKQGDLTLVASKVEAANEAYLYAGKDLNVLAAQDSDYSLYDMKKKGSFGAKKTKRDEVTDVRNLGSEIKAGGDITLKSEGDQTYQAAKLSSGKDLTLDSGGDITFEAVKDLHQESHEKSSNSLAWTSMKGKGSTDETLRQSELMAQGQLAIQAANKIHIDVKDINAQSVSQTVDAMVKADPNLAWIKQAEAQGDIDWRQVKEIHDSFKYSHSGLGAGAQLVLAIVMAAFVGPAALGALTTAGAGAAVAAGGAAVATSAATTATSSFISNRGNLGGVFKDTFSGDAVRGYVVSGVTAGLTAGVYDSWTGTQTSPSTVAGTSGNGSSLLSNSGRVTGASLNTWSGIGRFAANQALQNTTSAVLGKLLGQQGDLGDALRNGLASTFAAAGFNLVGNIGFKNQYAPGSVQMVGLHALMGGLAAVAAGGDFKAGALAAGASEALVTTLDNQFSSLDDAKRQNLLTMTSQLVGVAAAAVVDKGDGEALQTGASVAQSGVQYNYLADHEMQMLDKDLQGCQAKGTCDEVFKTYYALHKANEAELQATCSAGATPACKKLALDIYNATYQFQKAGYGAELTGDASKILIAFRQFNLEAQSTASGLIALPSAKAFIEALGVDPESAAGAAAAVAMASFFSGKSVSGTSGKILGSNGVKTASKTIWKGEGKERIDVENPNPGQRPGQIHYQDNNGNKYIYDIDSGKFRDAPNSVNKLLNNPGFYAAVQKGVKKYLGE